jgi:hypothetical protein
VSQPPNSPFNDDKPVREPIEHQSVSARVPERVGRAVYSTGQLVLDSPKEFVIDFLQSLTRPYQVGARVVITPQTMAEFIGALEQNLDNYTKSFGPPPALPPPPPNQPRPTIQEIYENFKLPDEQLSGNYSNSVLIGHSPTEFFFDFITSFYPTSAVSARVLIAAPHVPRFLNTLKTCLEQYQQRYMRPPQPPQEPPPNVG